MASRTVKLTLEANVKGLQTGLRTGQKAVHDFGSDVQKFQKTHSESLDKIGDASGKAGLAAAAGLALVGKAAMDWESAWTGVKKTVDGTPQQLGAVEDGLRGLARELPSTHTEIAAVAEAAGQLGVKTPDVVDFTKVMIDLGQSTNLSAEEAATGLARFSNVMGTSTDDVGRLGATLVGLGNNYATTESEILALSTRLSGAAAQINLSEGQTLGLAAAMSSVGIEAEAGGSAMSLTMKKIGKAVDSGDDKLSTFAETAGMSAEQFSTMWKDDAAGALEQFVLGLGRAGESGESVNAILDELGIKGIREADALLRLSSAGELMGDGMKQGAQEFVDGTALIEEASKRYETAESKVKIAWNNIKDAAIEAGEVMLPIIATLAEGAADLAQMFSGLPKPIQGFVTGLGGLVAVGGLGLAAVIKLAKSASTLHTAFRDLVPAGGKANTAIRKVGKAAGIATIALIGIQALGAIFSREHSKSAEDYAQAIIRVSEAGDTLKGTELDKVFQDFDTFMGGSRVKGVDSLTDAIGELANPSMGDGLNKNLNFLNGFMNLPDDKLTILEGRFSELGASLGQMSDSGLGDKAAKTFSLVAEGFEKAGGSAQMALDYMPAYTEALKKQANAVHVSVEDSDLLKWALSGVAPEAVAAAQGLDDVGAAGEGAKAGADSAADGIDSTADAAESAAEALNDMLDALVATGQITLSERDSLRSYESAVDDARAALKENGKTLDETTAKGRANGDALDAIADTTLGLMSAQKDAGASASEMATTIEQGRDAFIKQATAMGMSKEAAGGLADGMNLIPSEVYTAFTDNAPDMAGRLAVLKEQIEATPDKTVTISDNSPETVAALKGLGYKVKELPDGKVKVTDDGTVAKVAEKLKSIKDRTVKTEVTDGGTINTVKGGIKNIKGKTEKVFITDEGTAHAVQERVNNVTGKTEYVYVDDNGTTQVVQGQIDGVRDGSAKVNVTDGGSISWIQTAINQIHGTDVAVNIRKKLYQTKFVDTINLPQKQHGGRVGLPGLAGGGQPGGGRLPRTGLGTDQILGVNDAGRPTARVNDREWVINDKSSEKHNGLLGMINRDDPRLDALPALASGGRAEKQQRKWSDRWDAKRSLIRLEVKGDMSTVDKLFDLSKNADYSKKARQTAGRMAGTMEKHILSLEKKSEALSTALETATKRRDELLSVKEGVASGLRGEFSLAGVLDTARQDLSQGFSAKSIIGGANERARRIEIFAGRLNRLRKMGYSEAIIQEVAELGSAEGIQVAGVLMNATGKEQKSLNKAYGRMDKAANQAGQYVTESMYKGGLNAADGLVRGLEKSQAKVNRGFTNLGNRGVSAFKKTLGIHSPSRVMMAAGIHTGEGAELGILSKVSDVQKAMGQLGATPGMGSWGTPTVPPSREVSAHAGGAGIDYERLASAVWGVAQSAPIHTSVSVGGRQFIAAIVAAQKDATRGNAKAPFTAQG